MTTLEKLQNKANSSIYDKVKMPSISEIAKMLTEMGIKFNCYDSVNTVEYKSKGCRYVNSRRTGKRGKKLIIPILDEEKGIRKIELDTSDSYYSRNSWYYAKEIIELLKTRGKL